MTPRRLRRSDLAPLALLLTALVLAACGGDEKGQEGVTATADQPLAEGTAADPGSAPDSDPTDGDDGTPGDDATAEPGPVPSDYARRTIARTLLRLYAQTGANLQLEWWVIAAVDQIDLNAGNPNIPPRERIPGIAYSLAAAGAPYDYRAALAARAGAAYADRALKLAGRYVDTAAEQRED